MKVLVVIDMQNDFIDGSLGTDEAQRIVPSVANKIKNFHGKIFLTRDTHFENYLNTFEGKKLPVKHCLSGSHGWMINKEIMNALPYDLKDGEELMIINKGSFGWLNWECDMPKEEIEEIELCGLCTDICVVSNALILRAKFPNTKIVVDARCCAGVTPEKHKAALEVMKSCQIDVINED